LKSQLAGKSRLAPDDSTAKPMYRSIGALLVYSAGVSWALFAYSSYLPRLNLAAIDDLLHRLTPQTATAGWFAALAAALVLACLAAKKIWLPPGGVFGLRLGFRLALLASAFLSASLIALAPVAILAACWLWVLSNHLGHLCLSALRVEVEPGIEEFTIGSAIGFSLLSWLVLSLAVLHLLDTSLVLSFLVLLTASWLLPLRTRKFREIRWEQLALSVSIADVLLSIFVLVNLVIVLISALGPAIEFDDLAYHLVGPKTFVTQHGLAAIPDVPHTFLPKNVEMLFTLAMVLRGEVLAKLLHFILGLLAMFACYSSTRRVCGRTGGLLGAAILVSSPLFTWDMRTAHNDVALSLYLFLAAQAVFEGFRTTGSQWLRAAALFMSFALGIKYQALWGWLSLGVALPIAARSRFHTWRPALKLGLAFAGISLLDMVPWGIVNWSMARNPAFPFLNGLFFSPYWTPELTELIVQDQKKDSIIAHWPQLWTTGRVFWDMLRDQSNAFRGRIGPFFFVLPPLLLLAGTIPRTVKLHLGFSAGYCLLWALLTQHSRFLLPVLPSVAVVAAWATTAWIRRLGVALPRFFPLSAVVLLFGMAVFASPFLGRYGTHAHYGTSLMGSFPLRLLLGIESKDFYLAKHVPSYRAVKHFNSLTGDKKQFFWWSSMPAIFYVEGDAAWLFSRFGPALLLAGPEEFHRILRDNGITHIVDTAELEQAGPLAQSHGEFVQRYLRKIGTFDRTTLYVVRRE
jgi:Dolichyl-phosphate-mannose-protein mannosyltransferase